MTASRQINAGSSFTEDHFMFYRIPVDHFETFESFFNRLTLWEDFQVLHTSTDPSAPPTTAEMWGGYVTYEFIPSHVSKVLRMNGETRRMVLLSPCKTMVIAYRYVGNWYEVTLYRERASSCIETLYNRYRGLAQRSVKYFELASHTA